MIVDDTLIWWSIIVWELNCRIYFVVNSAPWCCVVNRDWVVPVVIVVIVVVTAAEKVIVVGRVVVSTLDGLNTSWSANIICTAFSLQPRAILNCTEHFSIILIPSQVFGPFHPRMFVVCWIVGNFNQEVFSLFNARLDDEEQNEDPRWRQHDSRHEPLSTRLHGCRPFVLTFVQAN